MKTILKTFGAIIFSLILIGNCVGEKETMSNSSTLRRNVVKSYVKTNMLPNADGVAVSLSASDAFNKEWHYNVQGYLNLGGNIKLTGEVFTVKLIVTVDENGKESYSVRN
jgi:hypothetical protein